MANINSLIICFSSLQLATLCFYYHCLFLSLACRVSLREGRVAAVAAPPAHRERGHREEHRRPNEIGNLKVDGLRAQVEPLALEHAVVDQVAHYRRDDRDCRAHGQPVIPAVELHRVDHIVEQGCRTPGYGNRDHGRDAIHAVVVHGIAVVVVVEHELVDVGAEDPKGHSSHNAKHQIKSFLFIHIIFSLYFSKKNCLVGRKRHGVAAASLLEPDVDGGIAVAAASREGVVGAAQEALEPEGGVGKVARGRIAVVVAGRAGDPLGEVVAQVHNDLVGRRVELAGEGDHVGHALEKTAVVARDVVGRDALDLDSETAVRLHGIVGSIGEKHIVLLQGIEVDSDAEGQHARELVALAVSEQGGIVAVGTETAHVATPAGQHVELELSLCLVEAVAVEHVAQVQEVGIALVGRHAVDERGVGHDDDVERARAFVLERHAAIGVIHAVEVAQQLLDDDRLALVVLEDAGGQAVFLVENLGRAHSRGVAGRVDEVGDQDTHVVGLLRLEDFVEDDLEIGIGGVARALGGGIDVAVLQKRVDRAAIGVDAVVHNVDAHTLLAREVVDEVVDGLLELAATPLRVVGYHRPAALEVDRERERLGGIGLHVPRHGRPQLLPYGVDVAAQGIDVDIALGIDIVAVLLGIALEQVDNAVVARLGGVALNEGLSHCLLERVAPAAAGHDRRHGHEA